MLSFCRVVPQRACRFLSFCWPFSPWLVCGTVRLYISSYRLVARPYYVALCPYSVASPRCFHAPTWGIPLVWDQTWAVKLKSGSLALVRFCSELRSRNWYLGSGSPGLTMSKASNFEIKSPWMELYVHSCFLLVKSIPKSSCLFLTLFPPSAPKVRWKSPHVESSLSPSCWSN